MSQETPETKYVHGNVNLPIIEDDKVLVYKNQAGQIFVQDKKSGTILQISECNREGGGLELVIRKGTLTPVSVNGELGLRIVPLVPR